jgi:hypothetical protein
MGGEAQRSPSARLQEGNGTLRHHRQQLRSLPIRAFAKRGSKNKREIFDRMRSNMKVVGYIVTILATTMNKILNIFRNGEPKPRLCIKVMHTAFISTKF